ncbi:hypothetical protein ACVWZ6_001588 [Bradyrhizobium sp. GM6.1]
MGQTQTFRAFLAQIAIMTRRYPRRSVSSLMLATTISSARFKSSMRTGRHTTAIFESSFGISTPDQL